VASGTAVQAMERPRVARDSSVFFVRCQLFDSANQLVTENVYWQSQEPDDLGDPENDSAFELRQISWADMTGLNYLPQVPLDVSAQQVSGAQDTVAIRLHNPSRNVAFFQRAEVLAQRDGDEILPVEYSDNYVTVFPGETVELQGVPLQPGITANWVRLSGYNTTPVVVPIGKR
jgi:exo-1,4-beta-D-glucosaminidase